MAPEVLEAIVVYLKGDFLDSRLRINTTIVDYDLQDTWAQGRSRPWQVRVIQPFRVAKWRS